MRVNVTDTEFEALSQIIRELEIVRSMDLNTYQESIDSVRKPRVEINEEAFLPRLAELLGLSVEELLAAKPLDWNIVHQVDPQKRLEPFKARNTLNLLGESSYF